MPEPVALFAVGFEDAIGARRRPFERAERLYDYWAASATNGRAIAAAWNRLETAARSIDDSVRFFSSLPDEPQEQPFAAIFGKRTHGHPNDEREIYETYRGQCEALLKLAARNTKLTRHLMHDASMTAKGSRAVARYRNALPGLKEGLFALSELLELADPAAKYPSRRGAGPVAARQNYVQQVAALNRYFLDPHHADIVKLANANCSSMRLTAAQVGKCWQRFYADKNR